jgi:hypothetical protein
MGAVIKELNALLHLVNIHSVISGFGLWRRPPFAVNERTNN